MLDKSPTTTVSASGVFERATSALSGLRACRTTLCPAATRSSAAICPRPSAEPVINTRAMANEVTGDLAVTQGHERPLHEVVEQCPDDYCRRQNDAGQLERRQVRRFEVARQDYLYRFVRQVGRVGPQRDVVGARDSNPGQPGVGTQCGDDQERERHGIERITGGRHEERVAVDIV